MSIYEIFILVLTLMFIAFKLLDIITWSWIWILSPIWIVCLIALIIIMIMWLFLKYLEKK